jgi:serine protease DegS
MKQFFTFVFWPAMAGLAFAIALLITPHLARFVPGLAPFLDRQPVPSSQESSQLSFSSAIRKAIPAVVSINNLQLVNRRFRIRLTPNITGIGNLFDENTTLGSGVIISPEGHIVTSYHVMFNPDLEIIRPEQDISVTLNDGRSVAARLIYLDAKNDLALLKIDAEHVTHLPMPENNRLEYGDIVLAIGNPRNIGQSVSFGIISALWKRGDSYVIQTDAAINPGNSGGALVDINGNFIGINSTIVSESGGSEGISFAVPAAKAMDLMRQYLDLESKKDTEPGYLGVNAASISLEQGQREYGFGIQGFLVNSVAPGSAADMAGLRAGDIITAVNDQNLQVQDTIDKAEAYKTISVISALKPGTLIMIEVFREDKGMRIPVILGYGSPLVTDPSEELGQPLDGPISEPNILPAP